ncbi:GNAT family N-acetyltransferase [Crossiella sp. SN42]|uniref:GNAT family N-acetyltransferase n=1 Tax=Crossiella sp. SN42 TaxID=2944808 RepID=UPI00207CF65C|nr:GNAT family N-acetyltransferase [Crossiella sp. SN42]MCO1580626.1 GNAT family N-acetyltransferase [Crossiella sp. SN42]
MHLATLANRPDLRAAHAAMDSAWPEFMRHSPVSALLDTAIDRFPEYQLMLLEQETLIGYGHSVPFTWDGNPETLPDQGWDAIIGDALADADEQRQPTAATLLEIVVVPERQGEGLSTRLATALRDHAAQAGLTDLVAPLRPSHKHLEPHTPMPDYVARRRPDGLPEDPWLRVHVRLGAQILHTCPASMAIAGSLAQWREWTGLPFDRDGTVEVPGALAPVLVSTAQDHAVYVEPNVWIRHRLS